MKYLILGAGPAGLTIANKMRQAGISNFLILEKESTAGGLCRSVSIDEAPLDIGGGHFLDVRNTQITNFLFQFMPVEEWNKFERNTEIEINNQIIGQPIESYIWQFDIEDQVAYLKSIASAGCNSGKGMPDRFVEWIYWKLGDKIAGDYMIPYNQKVFGQDLNELGTYWLDKLPNVSFEDTLRSCLCKKKYGKDPGHTKFYYPKKYGYGELWIRMANAVKDNILYQQQICEIDFINHEIVTRIGEHYRADVIISSIPWKEFSTIKGMPEEIVESFDLLKHSSIQVEYIAQNLSTNAHWRYYPDPKLTYHRALMRHNFCPNSKGYWTETNADRIKKDSLNHFTYMNEYAYPLNTINKPQVMKNVLEYASAHNVYGVGRWGEHQHYNSDVTVERALEWCAKYL